MRPRMFALLSIICSSAVLAEPKGAALTDQEVAWLRHGAPVLRYAQQQGLPLDIVVQPQATPAHAPLSMGFVEGRCKLVLSMRDNPRTETELAGLAPVLVPPAREAMFAHEIGHCWRYVQGTWHSIPDPLAAAGFIRPPIADEPLAEMQATRREEGFADLVGLAWTRHRHPALYERIHAWFAEVRSDPVLSGGHHDTRAWIEMSRKATSFQLHGTLFEQAHELWQRGLTPVQTTERRP